MTHLQPHLDTTFGLGISVGVWDNLGVHDSSLPLLLCHMEKMVPALPSGGQQKAEMTHKLKQERIPLGMEKTPPLRR